MARLKYVCISDLHLGAGYSILSNPKQPLVSSPTLAAFAPLLRGMIPALKEDDAAAPPQLLLLGDILDLGLSPVEDTAKGFQRLLYELYPPGVAPVLSYDVLFVPGNHDHMIWRWTEGERYASSIAKTGTIGPIDPVTPMFQTTPDDFPVSTFLTALMNRILNRTDTTVRVAYPNLAVANATTKRGIVFHHGHYTESMYRMMTELREMLGLGGGAVTTVAELEKENSAWMDFVWSTLGDSGLVGDDVGNLYFLLQEGGATEQWIRKLSKRLVHTLEPRLPMGGEREVQKWATRVIRALLDMTIQRSAETERNSYEKVLTEDTRDGLAWYLDVPVAQQFVDEKQSVPDNLVFVFGHTHKPFQDAIVANSYARPVMVFNLGGWVLDEPVMASLEGASMVLVDDDLNVVSIRLYNQIAGSGPKAVHVQPSAAYPQNNPLLQKVTNHLATTDWSALTRAIAGALASRESEAIDRYDLRPRNRSVSTSEQS